MAMWHHGICHSLFLNSDWCHIYNSALEKRPWIPGQMWLRHVMKPWPQGARKYPESWSGVEMGSKRQRVLTYPITFVYLWQGEVVSCFSCMWMSLSCCFSFCQIERKGWTERKAWTCVFVCYLREGKDEFLFSFLYEYHCLVVSHFCLIEGKRHVFLWVIIVIFIIMWLWWMYSDRTGIFNPVRTAP